MACQSWQSREHPKLCSRWGFVHRMPPDFVQTGSVGREHPLIRYLMSLPRSDTDPGVDFVTLLEVNRCGGTLSLVSTYQASQIQGLWRVSGNPSSPATKLVEIARMSPRLAE